MSELAAPIVAVLKSDKNSVGICGDFSVTINPVSKLDRNPIPKVNSFFPDLVVEILQQAGPQPGIPAGPVGGGVEEVRVREHPSRVILIYPTSVWGFFGTRHIQASD